MDKTYLPILKAAGLKSQRARTHFEAVRSLVCKSLNTTVIQVVARAISYMI